MADNASLSSHGLGLRRRWPALNVSRTSGAGSRSVDGFISEGLQPSELGWGTHEKWLPPQARAHDDPAAPSIYLDRPGADTRVRTWCPTAGPQYGLCVTHNESISIADYSTMTSDSGEVRYRPTCHYAYHPADDAIFVGVIGYAASFVLYNYAIARVRAAPASIIVNLIPVFGLASAVFWLGDSLTVARVLGAILIGLSVTIFTATELAEARSDAKANVTPSKA